MPCILWMSIFLQRPTWIWRLGTNHNNAHNNKLTKDVAKHNKIFFEFSKIHCVLSVKIFYILKKWMFIILFTFHKFSIALHTSAFKFSFAIYNLLQLLILRIPSITSFDTFSRKHLFKKIQVFVKSTKSCHLIIQAQMIN